jgi:hypothetical protein
MEYKNATQEVLLPIESILRNANQLLYTRLSLLVRYPSSIQFPSKSSGAIAVLTVSIAATILNFSPLREVTEIL